MNSPDRWPPENKQSANEKEAKFQALAQKHKLRLISGSMFELDQQSRVYNTSTVIHPEGEIVSRYRKLFTFRPYEADVKAGENFCVFDLPGCLRGKSIM